MGGGGRLPGVEEGTVLRMVCGAMADEEVVEITDPEVYDVGVGIFGTTGLALEFSEGTLDRSYGSGVGILPRKKYVRICAISSSEFDFFRCANCLQKG